MANASSRLARVLHSEVAGGIVLLACTGVALAVASSPAARGAADHRGPRRHARSAAVYLMLSPAGPATRGWGIPMATDIAFVVGCIALLGTRVTRGLRVFLLTLAIVDDVGAILVIAVGYATGIATGPLALAALGLAAILGLQFIGVRAFAAYGIVGALVWLAVLHSGVHATIAGVILGLLTPARPAAGVAFEPRALGDPVALAVAAGLVVGKPVGVVAASWLAVRAGVSRLPDGVGWTAMLGAGMLAGIGFTMALFIAGLALPPEIRDAAKVGILAASALAAVAGMLVFVTLPSSARNVAAAKGAGPLARLP